MVRKIKYHIFTLKEKIGLMKLGLLLAYGIGMFCLGMGMNYLFSEPRAITVRVLDKEGELALQEVISRPYDQEIPEDQLAEEAYEEQAGLKIIPEIARPYVPAEEIEEEAEPEIRAEDISEQEPTTPATPPSPGITTYKAPAYSEYINELTVKKGDTLSDLLVQSGMDREEAFLATKELSKHYSLRGLQIGQKIQVVFREGSIAGKPEGDTSFLLMRIEEPEKIVELQRKPDGNFNVAVKEKQLKRELMRAQGTITSSLYALSDTLAVPLNIVQDAVNAFSFDVDFQRDIKKGTSFRVLYESYFDENGRKVRDGNMLYAGLILPDREVDVYYFSPTGKDSDADYYNESGALLRKTIMKTPINAARISSGFGVRRHPISGYTKMHKGVDFAAPRGTPIYAAGEGTITRIGWNGGYGNYIRVRHNAELDTAYAHLNRFAQGMKRGRRVRQGQVIGYVGTTGSSTGPHLHFEVLQHGKQINPMKLNLKPTRSLEGAALKKLQTQVKQIKSWLRNAVQQEVIN